MKVLQSRHPDINTLAYVAFVCFGVLVFMTLVGIVSHDNTVTSSICCP